MLMYIPFGFVAFNILYDVGVFFDADDALGGRGFFLFLPRFFFKSGGV